MASGIKMDNIDIAWVRVVTKWCGDSRRRPDLSRWAGQFHVDSTGRRPGTRHENPSTSCCRWWGWHTSWSTPDSSTTRSPPTSQPRRQLNRRHRGWPPGNGPECRTGLRLGLGLKLSVTTFSISAFGTPVTTRPLRP